MCEGPFSLAAARHERPRAIKVLFLGDQGHHRPADRAAQITPVLAGRGIDVTYTEKLGDLNPETLARYDALLIYANITEISPDQEKALLDYVERRRRLRPGPLRVVLLPQFAQVHRAGRRPVSAARHGRVRHQDRRPVASDHEGLRCRSAPGTRPTCTPSTTTRTATSCKRARRDRPEEPWTWVRTEGKGRVFYTAYGHDARTWQNPGFHDLIERGIRWASAKGEVFDSRGRVAAGLPPFTYEESPAEIPNYLPGRQWGTQGEAIHKMQKPLAPAESMKHLVVPPGFEPRLFAAEPEIYKPICMTWDQRGRLWIAESIDYPNTKQPRRPGPRPDHDLRGHQRRRPGRHVHGLRRRAQHPHQPRSATTAA